MSTCSRFAVMAMLVSAQHKKKPPPVVLSRVAPPALPVPSAPVAKPPGLQVICLLVHDLGLGAHLFGWMFGPPTGKTSDGMPIKPKPQTSAEPAMPAATEALVGIGNLEFVVDRSLSLRSPSTDKPPSAAPLVRNARLGVLDRDPHGSIHARMEQVPPQEGWVWAAYTTVEPA